MKKFLFIAFLFVILGCKADIIDWNIEENPYTIETIEANEENTLVVRRIHDIEDDKKYVEFKFYLSSDGVTRFILRYNKFFPEIEETKDNFTTICQNFGMELDNYFYESLDDLEIQDIATDRNDFSSNLVIITDENPNLELIITISNGEANYEIWDDNTIEIENGTNEKMSIESKIYD